MIFDNRQHAGRLLGDVCAAYNGKDVLVLGLARGGVVVAHKLATQLHVPFDVLVIRKIPSPMEQELAIGAVAPDGVSFINRKLAQRVGVDEKYIKKAVSRQSSAIREKTRLYRIGRKPYNFQDKTVIIVDDGAATGATMEAAIKWCKTKHARRCVVAVAVAPKEFVERIKHTIDDLVVLESPTDFSAVGQWYKDFGQVEDGDVIKLLR